VVQMVDKAEKGSVIRFEKGERERERERNLMRCYTRVDVNRSATGL